MAAQTVDAWVKTLPKRSNDIQRGALTVFDRNTVDAQSRARSRAPETTGALARQTRRLKARIVNGKVKSFLVNMLPYAPGMDDEKSGLRLKARGENSVYRNGRWIKKKRRGRLGFVTEAVEKQADPLVKELGDMIGRVWAK